MAAINGAAVGVGITMCLPMDVRLMSSAARIGFVFNKRGMATEAGSRRFLPRLVGMRQAQEWVMTAELFGADEALKGGLVRSIHAPDDSCRQRKRWRRSSPPARRRQSRPRSTAD